MENGADQSRGQVHHRSEVGEEACVCPARWTVGVGQGPFFDRPEVKLRGVRSLILLPNLKIAHA